MSRAVWLAALFAVAGCSGAANTDGDTESRVANLRKAIDECYEPLAQCEGEECAETATRCLSGIEAGEVPPEAAVEPCIEEHAECLAETGDEALCEEVLDACFDCVDEDPEGADDVIEACYQAGDACMDDATHDEEAEACFDVVEACVDALDIDIDDDAEDDYAAVCFECHEHCLEENEDDALCEEALEECLEFAIDEKDYEAFEGEACFIEVEECFLAAADELDGQDEGAQEGEALTEDDEAVSEDVDGFTADEDEDEWGDEDPLEACFVVLEGCLEELEIGDGELDDLEDDEDESDEEWDDEWSFEGDEDECPADGYDEEGEYFADNAG